MNSSEHSSCKKFNRMPAGKVRESFFKAILDLQLLHVRWRYGLQ